MKHNKKIKEESPIVQKDYTIQILLILTIIGAVFRFYNLGFNSIWLDEAVTYVHSLTLSGIFDYTNSVDYFNPPLFPLFEFVMIQTTGASEWGLRFFPALFGILTIPAAYLMGKEFHNKYTGLVTAIIFAFSPFLIYYSQEARAFSMLLFFCTILMYVFLKAMKSNLRNDWLVFGVVSAIVFATHFYGAVFIAILVIFAAVDYRNNIWELLYGLLGLFLVFPLILLTIFLYFQRISTGTPTYGLQGMDVIAGTLTQLAGFTGGYGRVIFLILIAIGGIWLTFKNKERAYLLVWIIAATFIISTIASSHIPIIPRYMIFLMIPFSLAIASLYAPIANLTSNRTKHLALVALFLVAFGMLGMPFYQTYYTTYYKEDWRGISQNLTALTNREDVIVIAPRYIEAPLNFYYSAEKDRTIEVGVMSKEELLQFSNGWNQNQSIYYIVTGDIGAADPSGELMQMIQQNTKVVKQSTGIYILKGV
jgi:4-amino-4-deoxy-L-arabinose transferase-like glycosyltransferase